MNEQELRDYFSAAALTRLLSNPELNTSVSGYAKDAYLYTDATLKEHKREQ